MAVSNNVALLTQDPNANNNAALVSMAGGGSTSERPNNPPQWFHFFDISLSKEVVWTGLDWAVSSGGPQGGAGTQGAQGAVGSQGFQGSSGGSGPQGFQGVSGSQGFQGASSGSGTATMTTVEGRSAGNSTIGHITGINVGGSDGVSKLVVIVTGLEDSILPINVDIGIYQGAALLQSAVTDGVKRYYTFVISSVSNTVFTSRIEFPDTDWVGIKTLWSVTAGTAYFNNGSCRGAVIGPTIAGPFGFAIRLGAWGSGPNTLIANARFVKSSTLAVIPGTSSNINGSATNPRLMFVTNDEVIIIGTPGSSTAEDAIADFNF